MAGQARRYMQRRRELEADFKVVPLMGPDEKLIPGDPATRLLVELARGLGAGVTAHSLAVLERNGVPVRLVGTSMYAEDGTPLPAPRPVTRRLDPDWKF